MPVTVKRGATVRIILTFTAEEWAPLYPWTSIKAEAQSGVTGGSGWVEHEFAISVDAPARKITLTAPTQPWGIGTYQWDVRIEKDGESIFLPPETTDSIKVIEGITE